MLWKPWVILLGVGAALLGRAASRADNAKPAATAAEVTALVTALKSTQKESHAEFHKVLRLLEQQLSAKDGAEATVKLLLDRKEDFEFGRALGQRLETLIAQKKDAAAAELLLQVAKAKKIVAGFGKGGVVVGRVVVADGKLEPDLVLAQMPISADGLFAGEVGDMGKPIVFRAMGYEEVEIPLAGKTGHLLDVGTVTLKPLAAGQKAALKGAVVLDAEHQGETTGRLTLMVPRANTPHNGFSPRRRWPSPLDISFGKDGAFSTAGLTPGDYYLTIEAKGHTSVAKKVKVEPGKENDQGTLRLRSTDLSFYLGKAAPKTAELLWEKDYQTALTRAAAEKKPVLVMMTATWCVPCKMLEKETLNDPWVRHFLSGFVLVKAYEDKEVEKIYGLNGYPSLVFTDSAGKQAHRTTGHQQPVPFLAQCVTTFEKLAVEMPGELKILVEKKVLAND